MAAFEMLQAVLTDDHSCQCGTNTEQAVELMRKGNFSQALPGSCEQAIEACAVNYNAWKTKAACLEGLGRVPGRMPSVVGHGQRSLRKNHFRLCPSVAQDDSHGSGDGDGADKGGASSVASSIYRFKARKDHGGACQMGVWSWQEGDYPTAIRYYECSIQIDPQPPTYFNMAVCFDDMVDRPAAVAALRQFSITLRPPLHEVAGCEAMLRDNGKASLIKQAKQKRDRLKGKERLPQLGSRTSAWAKPFIGKNVDASKLEGWMDFGDPRRTIFTYPSIPGIYATIVNAVGTYCDWPCRVSSSLPRRTT